MPVEEEGFTPETPVTPEPAPSPRRVKTSTKYRVRRMTEDGADPVVFSHEDRGVARRYVETNHPRGREVYVEHPGGYREHFSADQQFQGSDNGGWNELEDEEE